MRFLVIFFGINRLIVLQSSKKIIKTKEHLALRRSSKHNTHINKQLK